MPASILSKGHGKYQVRTPNRVHSKATTKKKAKAQQRLLNAMEHNPEFKKKMHRSILRGKD